MKKVVTFAGICLLLAGCGARIQDEVAAQILTKVGDVSTTLSAITKELKEAVAGLKANEQLTTGNQKLEEAIRRAKELRKTGEELQSLKAQAEILREKTSPDLSQELLEKHRQRLLDDLTKLDKQYQDLEAALAEAASKSDTNARARINDLRTEINNGRDAFDLLNKLR